MMFKRRYSYSKIRNASIKHHTESFNFRGSILLDHPCIVSRLLFRSLHDLSCQFGTRGFTKQMRQIAGGSKAGLRKFLLQYPSLFAIQNDTVQVAKIPPRSKSVSYFELPKVIWG